MRVIILCKSVLDYDAAFMRKIARYAELSKDNTVELYFDPLGYSYTYEEELMSRIESYETECLSAQLGEPNDLDGECKIISLRNDDPINYFELCNLIRFNDRKTETVPQTT